MFQLQSRFIALRGPKQFLQGLITNDINSLTRENPIHALLLNNKGRFLHDFFLYQLKEGEILVEYHNSHREELLKLLSLYNLHKKIEIVEENYNSYISFKRPADDLFEYVCPNPLNRELGFKIITEKRIESNQEIFREYELRRIKNRIPDCSIDLIIGSSFPLEYNLRSSFNFNKGCYVGQEVALRFRLPESLKRDIFVIRSDDKFPDPHTELLSKGEKIGKALSSCDGYGLALLEKDKIHNEQVNCLDFKAVIIHASFADVQE